MGAALHTLLIHSMVNMPCHDRCAVGCNWSELHTAMSAWLQNPQGATQWHRERTMTNCTCCRAADHMIGQG